MNHRSLLARRVGRSLAGASLALGLVVIGCQDRPICPGEPNLTATIHERLANSAPDKVDVLLAVDNSQSMADKQALLALAVPDLVGGLVNPPCLDTKGQPVEPGPKSPLEKCPVGSERPFNPVLDIHIGVISSSLGSHGADTCQPKPTDPTEDDRGHLLSRADPSGTKQLPTYQDQGFLAWDPSQKLTPPGEADLDQDSAADPNDTALLPVLADMITGVGQEGCGFESQLESWYRFLVDPSPYETLTLDDAGHVKLEGIDQTLLTQRKQFLRPDSLLAIVLLTDEDDCSVRDAGDYHYALQAKSGQDAFHLPAPRSECAADPNDPCCFSCAQKGPQDDSGDPVCPPDPACKDDQGKLRYLSITEDPLNLRCWDQKRRFGIDFLNPIDRYTKGLTEPTVLDRNGQMVPNPIFSDLDTTDGNLRRRDPSMVILTGIVGVPWQDLARDPEDLTKGFKSSEELGQKDANGKTTWDIVLGDPSKNVAPEDPLMIASPSQRKGTNPITGAALATSQDNPLGNPINGHDFEPRDQLQYACIFPLPEAIPCTLDNCHDPSDSPVFDPPYSGNPTEQKRAGAVPGTRFLQLLRSLGDQGVAASVCPAQTTDKSALDFGYRPAVAAALSRLQVSLTRSCLPRTLATDGAGQVNCVVIEARKMEAKDVCCDPSSARQPVSAEHQSALDGVKQDPQVTQLGYDCFCEIPQLQGTAEGEPLYACQNDTARAPTLPNGDSVDGYCYIDQAANPPVGNPALVASCPETERRNIRFVGKGNPANGSTLFIACGVSDDSAPPTCDDSLQPK